MSTESLRAVTPTRWVLGGWCRHHHLPSKNFCLSGAGVGGCRQNRDYKSQDALRRRASCKDVAERGAPARTGKPESRRGGRGGLQLWRRPRLRVGGAGKW